MHDTSGRGPEACPGVHRSPLLPNGIRDLVLLVGYKYQQVKNYFNDGGRFGVNLSYVLDSPGFIGSANAIVNAYRQEAISRYDFLVVYYGDILSNFDLGTMFTQHLNPMQPRPSASRMVSRFGSERLRLKTA